MMDSLNLELFWKSIKHDGLSEFVYKRIDDNCIPELNLAINSTMGRCLILELPRDHVIDLPTSTMQNLSLKYYEDTKCIVLQLLDENYNDLFNDLTMSLYLKIMHVSDIEEYSAVFIQTFYKWSEFFHEQNSEKLSRETIKGIFGELIYLRSFLDKASLSDVNYLLESWHGPYDTGHDFIFNDKNIEVKTKDSNKNKISISSEYQLEAELSKGLELAVISVDLDYVAGCSIKELVQDIRTLIFNRCGDFSILLKALQQKNITLKNISEYDNYRFKPIDLTTYDCLVDEFPKLVKSILPPVLSCVKYDINLKGIENFIIAERKF
ncbi:PD-(D/E)XK motif protein [Thalassomonas viridans]|uniref:PD-(D/E)XK motif protein n=1 Tax=Thalassomonas viridans TaxID=137584 RepID=A0AAE9YZB6_9GAMM|nr:PD-(D/E)XK motif protein [Thalassomonas viridans]WDE03708.1 PD-(D/E)XK motif protein [Thalassomonas viridans]